MAKGFMTNIFDHIKNAYKAIQISEEDPTVENGEKMYEEVNKLIRYVNGNDRPNQ